MDSAAGSLFRTVIISSACPSLLESSVRKRSQNIRNVECLPGHAMAVFPSSNAVSVAIRVYNLDELSSSINVSNIERSNNKTLSTKHTLHTSSAPLHNLFTSGSADFDRLQSFRDSFKFPVVFFISKRSNNQESSVSTHLDNPHSILHRVQDALVCAQHSDSHDVDQKGSAKVFLVPELASIIPIVHSIMESLKPEKASLKESYFIQETQKAFYPPKDPRKSHVNTLAASTHVASTLRSCIVALGISEGDANVVMSMFQTINGMISADDFAWNNIPIGNREKRILRSFLNTNHVPTTVDVSSSEEKHPWHIHCSAPATVYMNNTMNSNNMYSRHTQPVLPDIHTYSSVELTSEERHPWNNHRSDAPATVSMNNTMNSNDMYSRHSQPVLPDILTNSSVEMQRREKRNFKEFMSQRNMANVRNQSMGLHHRPYYDQYAPSRSYQTAYPAHTALPNNNNPSTTAPATIFRRPRLYRGSEYHGNFY